MVKEVCEELGMRKEEVNRTFCDDLGIPKGRVVIALENLEIDYQLPISGDDADHLHTIEEVVDHLIRNRTA